MRRTAKVPAAAARLPRRKSALIASAAVGRNFPAWIDAAERTVAFPAVSVTPRVRDALVLRTVAPPKSAQPKGPNHASGKR